MLPVISGGAYGFEHLNVAEQRRDPDSLLNWFERIIRMRKEVPEIGWGDFEIVDTVTKAVLGIRYDWRNTSVLILHNFAEEPIEITFDAGRGEKGKRLVDMLGGENSEAGKDGKHTVCLQGYGYRWYRVGGMDYLLNRTEIDEFDISPSP